MSEHDPTEQFPPAPEAPVEFPAWPPDERTRTPEQQLQFELWERAVAWLQQKWTQADGGAAACPYCHTREWSVGIPIQPIAVAGGAWGGFAPVFPVMCLTCGNTVLINAIMAGVLPADSADMYPSHPEATG